MLRNRTALSLKSDWLLLTIITMAALIVRLAGNQFGLPHHFHPDEPVLISAATRIAEGTDFNPHFFHWGGGHFYVTALFFRAASALGRLRTEADAYVIARSVSALMGALTVLLTMLIARRLCAHRWIAAGAGLVLAFTMLHVRCSHYATVDVPATFWLALSVWLFLQAISSDKSTLLFVSGLAGGVAAGTKYHLALIVPVLVAGLVVHRRLAPSGAFVGALLLMCGASVGFLSANPFAVIDYPAFSTGIGELLTYYDNPSMHPRNHGDGNWLFFVITLARGESDIVFMAAATVGVIVVLKEERRAAILALWGFPLVTFLYLSTKNANYVRNLMPILPFLAIASALGADWVVRFVTQRVAPAKRLAIAVVALSIVPAATRVGHFDRLLMRPDTRDLASAWLTANLPTSSKVAVERENWASPVLPSHALESRVILTESTVSDYAEQGYEFIITNSVSYAAYAKYPDRVEGANEAYRRLFADLEQHARLVATFTGDTARVPINDELPNPQIRVYQIK